MQRTPQARALAAAAAAAECRDASGGLSVSGVVGRRDAFTSPPKCPSHRRSDDCTAARTRGTAWRTRFVPSPGAAYPPARAPSHRDWLAESGVETLYIEPGAPWYDGYCESFNRRLCEETLNRELFMDLREAKVVVEDYRLDYNHRRTHSAWGYIPPASFAGETGARQGRNGC